MNAIHMAQYPYHDYHCILKQLSSSFFAASVFVATIKLHVFSFVGAHPMENPSTYYILC